MRKLIFISCILTAFLMFACRNSSGTSTPDNGSGKSIISFSEYEHDFGKVTEGEKLSYTFVFENKGTSDLIISSALTTCGCTVPKYDRKPIPPGSKGSLEVVFNTAGKEGKQTKTITVKSNASMPVVLLKITAEVMNSNQ